MLNKISLKTFSAAVFLVFILQFCCGAQLAWARTIIVGTSTGYPPYYYLEKGQLKGICVDIVNEVSNRMGIVIKYEQYPWKRMLYFGKTGKVDAVMPLFKTKERQQYLYFLNNRLAYEENNFFAYKKSNIDFTGSLMALRFYKIGVVKDYSYGENFDQAAYLSKIEVYSDEALLKMFSFKRFDLGIGNRSVILYHAHQLGIANQIEFLQPAVTRNPLYIGFSKKREHKRLAETFSKELEAFQSTPGYMEILKAFGL